MKTTLKLLVLFLVLGFNLQSQSLDEIVTKHIEAIGGQASWAKLKSMRMECGMKADGAEIKFVIYQIDKQAVRQDINVAGMTGYSIIKTAEGWNFAPWMGHTKPEPMTADDVKNAQDELYIQDDFITYKELGKKLEYFGKDDVDGTECHKLKMTNKDGKETTYFIDPSNYYVIKETEKKTVDGKETENSTLLSDYRKLDEGIVFPMSISGPWGEMTISKMEINPKIDEALFSVPK